MAGLIAIVAGLCVAFISSTPEAKSANAQDLQWEFSNAPGADPTDPDEYSQYSGELGTDCPGAAVVCGIIAPDDPDLPGMQPDIDEDLEDEINSGNETSNVFRKSAQ